MNIVKNGKMIKKIWIFHKNKQDATMIIKYNKHSDIIIINKQNETKRNENKDPYFFLRKNNKRQ